MAFTRKRTDSLSRKSSPIIGFRASDEERVLIEAAAKRAGGLSVSSYVRSRVLEKPTTRAARRPPVETAQLAQLLGLVGAVGGQIQELLQKHGGGIISPSEVEETMRAWRAASAEVVRALGKRPALVRERGT